MENILKRKNQLTEHQLSILASEMEKNQKSTGLAYVLLFFCGSLGIHKFYLGEVKMGLTYLILGLVGWISLIVGFSSASVYEEGAGATIFSILIFCVIGILLLIDLFTLPSQVKTNYEVIESQCIDSLLNSSN
ncbi:MAG: TM2 domain-containing protein [Sphaerochaetaceae bacterium]